MSSQQASPKITQYLILFAFAAQPILLMAFVAPSVAGSDNGTLIPILGSVLAGAGSLFWSMNRMDADQTLSKFQTNMLIGLAFAEIPTLLGIFIGMPAGLTPYPFVAATYTLTLFVFLRVVSYWSTKSDR